MYLYAYIAQREQREVDVEVASVEEEEAGVRAVHQAHPEAQRPDRGQGAAARPIIVDYMLYHII